MNRLSQARLLALAGELSERDRQMIETVVRLRLVSGTQLERLFFAATPNPASRARLTRRTLGRLVSLRLLGRLERRIGGVRAGAAGHVYYATPGGQRLAAYWQGEGLRRARSGYEPMASFVGIRSVSRRATCSWSRRSGPGRWSCWISSPSRRRGRASPDPEAPA